MTTDDFDEPTPVAVGDKVSMETFLNKLIIVRPVEFTKDFKTEFKPDGAEAVFANIAIIDGFEDKPWVVFQKVLVMQGYLVGAFKGSIGKNLLGTIYHGERKKGQKPPYMFASLKTNEGAVATGRGWLLAHRDELLGPAPQFDEPGTGKASAETMRAASVNPYMKPGGFTDEPPF